MVRSSAMMTKMMVLLTTVKMMVVVGQEGRCPPRLTPPPSEAALPGLASAPREAALEDRGFALGPAEFWAAAAAAAKVARFCNCRALIPGGEEPERVLSNLGTTSGPHPNWC